jgi:hypothetical protein
VAYIIGKHSTLKPHGVHIITDPAVAREIQADYHACVHCGCVWVVQPGSGKIRGFCSNCNGFICGPKCADCQGPLEKRLDLFEAGKIKAL